MSTASCSMSDTMTCDVNEPEATRRASAAAGAIPKSTVSSDSVEPDVKITSLGRDAPMSRAIDLRAASSASKAARPGEWSEFAFMLRARLSRPQVR